MKRIDLVYNSLKDLDKGEGISTIELSEYLNLERSNVSKDLNNLVKNGMVFKNNSRPVRYFFNNPNTNDLTHKSSLDNLCYLSPSLSEAVKLAKTAILYPPNGMDSLIIGDTGVGKSMLAKLMHEYFNSLDNTKDIPFVHFNCSDYSNNPQLLSSQLFGVKKGTYTGATEDRKGVIEEADGGILFLDEIHNLPKEGQEMLFVYMDTGYFRRFGEVSKKIKSSARIICATNKDINASLLDTFIRRIPVKIYLPSLEDRFIEERLTLIERFIKDESLRLNKPILVSKNSMIALLSYNCPYNVGQLKSDIKLAVANAYSDYFIHHKKQIKINSPDLQKDIKSSLLSPKEDALRLVDLMADRDGYFIYDKNSQITSHSFLKQKQTILLSYKEFMTAISIKIANNKELDIHQIREDFTKYFKAVIDNGTSYNFYFHPSAYEDLTNGIFKENPELKFSFTDDIIKNFFSIHVDMIYDRIDFIQYSPTNSISKLKINYPEYYSIANNIKGLIEKYYNVNLSETELLFLIIFIMCC